MDGIQLRFTNSRLVISLILIGLLSMTIGGCGSVGDSPPDSPPASSPVATPAEELWTGNTDTNRTIVGTVLDDGTYYFFYSEQVAPNLIGGLVQGNSTRVTVSSRLIMPKILILKAGLSRVGRLLPPMLNANS